MRAVPEHWERFFAFVCRYPIRYSVDGEERELPQLSQIRIDGAEHSLLLAVFVDGVQINCHFFDGDEIELDIDPREIGGSQQHDQVLRFLALLSEFVGIGALITPENGKHVPVLSYEVNRDVWRYHPAV